MYHVLFFVFSFLKIGSMCKLVLTYFVKTENMINIMFVEIVFALIGSPQISKYIKK